MENQQNEELKKRAEIEKEERMRAEARAKAEEEIKTNKKKEEQKKTGKGCLVVLGIIVFIAILVFLGGGNGEQTQPIERDTTSIVFAEEVIKGILKAPSTAKFVDVEAYELSNEKDVWAINGYVDSQNSFGAMIRSQWEVQLDYSDGKGGTVKSILFDGKKMQ
jgi:hypothetical protein